MFKYFNKEKEKKKSLIIQNVMSVEEFFNRGEYEISSDIWKMNTTQLEETINKQEKFIKHLQTLYQQQLEFIENDKTKQEDNLRKLKNHMEELEIKNESNVQQKELIEEKYKEIYLKFQPKENKNFSTQTEGNDQLEEEVNRLRNQCEKMCEEIQRFQEENDDLSVALEAEKKHKSSLQNQNNQKIQQLELNIQQLQQEHNKELEILQITLANNFSVDVNSKTKELESKVLQEKIKCDQKQKDCQRLEEEIKELKLHLEQQTTKYEQREGKLKLLEQKRTRDKNTIQKLQCDFQQSKQHLSEQNIKLINEISKANNEIYELKQKLEKQQIQQKEVVDQFEIQEKQLKIQQLELIIYEQQNTINMLEKKIDQVESQSIIKISELEKIIEQLNIKREYAKKEITELSQKLQNVHQDLNTSSSSRHQAKSSNIGHNKQKFLLFPTLKQMLNDVRKKEDNSYKLYMQAIMTEFKNQKEIIALESALNDVSRMTQDIIDLLEEMGLI
ncbi:unnamed protein product [Paramecium primaurelia]|uniref:Uncharacterized protein n=2 Tax=Paramecium TaxID=5884 RepID=A0A8S1WTJ7_9CILI|nr:unnamed protein product [Paramecium primaurelia]CAD8192117.1 unnamed protein product [Paramecium pentaurelia]